jgi:hypothetical protein
MDLQALNLEWVLANALLDRGLTRGFRPIAKSAG